MVIRVMSKPETINGRELYRPRFGREVCILISGHVLVHIKLGVRASEMEGERLRTDEKVRWMDVVALNVKYVFGSDVGIGYGLKQRSCACHAVGVVCCCLLSVGRSCCCDEIIPLLSRDPQAANCTLHSALYTAGEW